MLMQVFTSYFSYLRVHPLPEDIVPIAVCENPPMGFTGAVYRPLAPPEGYLQQYREDGNALKYAFCYNTYVLEKLVFCSVMLDLQKLMLSKNMQAKGFCLVSFEGPNTFNHRSLIATWFRAFGVESTEYNAL